MIADDFGRPERPIRFWNVPTSATPVPKASVNEHRNASAAEKEVRLARHAERMRLPAS
jgi:hypothetical protein